MGRKRKAGKTEEEIKRKIRKLERKLLESTKKKSRCIYSDDDENSQSEDSIATPHEGQRNPDAENSPPKSQPDVPHSPPPSPLLRVPTPTIPADKELLSDQSDLDCEILDLLGDAPKPDAVRGPPVHKDVASRWQEILCKGLTKEAKEKVLNEYLVPSNCEFLIAPTLNPEAKVALSDPLVKRDSFLMQKQKQLGIALSALASATTLILANETSKQKLIKPISDACRILCDNHYIDTKSRRNLVISSTNTQLKDTLIESVRDKLWLFGENISEKLRAAKTIQKSGDDLKNHSKSIIRPNYPAKSNKNRLNYKRKTDNRPLPSAPISASADSGRGRHQWRAPLRANLQHGSRRSPPARRPPHK